MMLSNAKKALVAMSGGVDSSVAAYLTRERGYDCAGAMMKLYTNDDAGIPRENGCCTLADAEDARAVAYLLDMPFYVFNFTDSFHEQVIRRFVRAYQNGETPNPCIDCNRYLKFDRFLKRAREIEMDYIVTGHYARIEYAGNSGRYLLKKGADSSKDQSYALYAMTQEQLAHTLLPLGELRKTQVRGIARDQGFINARKRESQDICFVPDGSYAGFIERYTGKALEKGRFADTSGKDLGEHKGIASYTVGQRRGLGLSLPEPVYVCGIYPESNTVVVGAEEELYARTLTAKDVNLVAVERIDAPMRVTAKIRYGQREEPATVCQTDQNALQLTFDRPQRAITKGQAAVLYDGDVVIGGGTIV